MKYLVFLLGHVILFMSCLLLTVFTFWDGWGFKLFLVIPLLGLLIGGSWALHRLQTRAGVKISWSHFYP